MFQLTFVTPEKRIVLGKDLEQIWVPGFRGELNILPGHAPLTSTLVPGLLKYRLKDGEEKEMAIGWGYLQVSAEGVSVMAESAFIKDEIDRDVAQKELKEIEKRIQVESLSDEDWTVLQRRMQQLTAEISL